jgi:hypothetical protein
MTKKLSVPVLTGRFNSAIVSIEFICIIVAVLGGKNGKFSLFSLG